MYRHLQKLLIIVWIIYIVVCYQQIGQNGVTSIIPVIIELKIKLKSPRNKNKFIFFILFIIFDYLYVFFKLKVTLIYFRYLYKCFYIIPSILKIFLCKFDRFNLIEWFVIVLKLRILKKYKNLLILYNQSII